MAERSVTPPAFLAMDMNPGVKDLLQQNDRISSQPEVGSVDVRSYLSGVQETVQDDGAVLTSLVISSGIKYNCGYYEEETIVWAGNVCTENRLQGAFREDGVIQHRKRQHTSGERTDDVSLFLVTRVCENVFDDKFRLTSVTDLSPNLFRIYTKLGVIFAYRYNFWAGYNIMVIDDPHQNAHVVTDSDCLSTSLTSSILKPENQINKRLDRGECDEDELISQGYIKEISNTKLTESAFQTYISNYHVEETTSEGRDGIKQEQRLEGNLVGGGIMYFRKRRYQCGLLNQVERMTFEVKCPCHFGEITLENWKRWRCPTTTAVLLGDRRSRFLLLINGMWTATQIGVGCIRSVPPYKIPLGLTVEVLKQRRALIMKEKAEKPKRERQYFRNNIDRWITG
jgi:hypothetical protein